MNGHAERRDPPAGPSGAGGNDQPWAPLGDVLGVWRARQCAPVSMTISVYRPARAAQIVGASRCQPYLGRCHTTHSLPPNFSTLLANQGFFAGVGDNIVRSTTTVWQSVGGGPPRPEQPAPGALPRKASTGSHQGIPPASVAVDIDQPRYQMVRRLQPRLSAPLGSSMPHPPALPGPATLTRPLSVRRGIRRRPGSGQTLRSSQGCLLAPGEIPQTRSSR